MAKKDIKIIPEQQYLMECFNYDPNIGILYWKERPLYHFKNKRGMNIWNVKFPNKIAGAVNGGGYKSIKIDFVSYLSHRIIWKMYYGLEPPDIIDHVDGDPSNNKINNLREATLEENSRNKPRLDERNKSGYTGVYARLTAKGNVVWRALIKVDKKNKHLGTFKTIEEAVTAREIAAKEHYGEFYPISSIL